jgi:hypothetical protein
MNRAPRWLALIALVLGTGLVTASATPAIAAPSARTTWHLQNYSQTRCFEASDPDELYGVYVQGHWHAPLEVGTSGLPSRAHYKALDAPIPPGHSDGLYSLAWVEVRVPANAPLGTYTAQMWASDGTDTQRVPITLTVESDCGY